LQDQLHSRFDAKAWLPFKMAQGTVKLTAKQLGYENLYDKKRKVAVGHCQKQTNVT
jgi:hypothetical protein